MQLITATALFSAFFWILFLISFTKDRSRYRNCYLLFAALVSAVPFLLAVSGEHARQTAVILINTVLIAILIVPFFLIHNGIVMIKKEGKHPAQLLSLALGVAILAGEAATAAQVFSIYSGRGPDNGLTPLLATEAAVSVTVAYVSVSFLIFMVFSLFLQVIPRKKDFDYVIIHGSGLLNGDRVPKLLQDRLDKAIEIYRKDPTPPVLIPSGGQGPDESIPEAEAMKRYMLSRGIPEKDILPEGQSRTTLENLQYSKEILDSREGRKYTALVTSNYHVYRALRYCRKIGLKRTDIGSHVAFYYWPSALIREFIAIHAEKKHAVLFAAGWLLSMACLYAAMAGILPFRW